jgi:hypothetical protein
VIKQEVHGHFSAGEVTGLFVKQEESRRHVTQTYQVTQFSALIGDLVFLLFLYISNGLIQKVIKTKFFSPPPLFVLIH